MRGGSGGFRCGLCRLEISVATDGNHRHSGQESEVRQVEICAAKAEDFEGWMRRFWLMEKGL
jgi:hypothetical protein